jgi:SAM-dependent methyltransferase
MDNTDFAKFYDKQPDYAAFRNDQGKREDYEIMSDWKARNLVSIIPDNLIFRNILEIGCAFGVLLNNIAGRLNIGARTGIDISLENIRLARELYPGCDFFQGILEDFIKEKSEVLKSQKFDLAVLSDIIEHIPDDLEFLKLIREISEYVVVNLPLERSFKNRKRKYGMDDTSGHLRSYDRKLAKTLFNDAGFIILRDFTSIATSDSRFFEVYRKNRRLRIMSKPFLLRIFWSLFYAVEDKFKLIDKRITGNIYGTNYFALLRSS